MKIILIFVALIVGIVILILVRTFRERTKPRRYLPRFAEIVEEFIQRTERLLSLWEEFKKLSSQASNLLPSSEFTANQKNHETMRVKLLEEVVSIVRKLNDLRAKAINSPEWAWGNKPNRQLFILEKRLTEIKEKLQEPCMN